MSRSVRRQQRNSHPKFAPSWHPGNYDLTCLLLENFSIEELVMLIGVLTYPGGCRIPSTAAFLSAEFTFLQVGLAVANEQLTSLDVQLRSCSVLRTLEEPEQSVVQDVVRTPARSPLAIVSGENVDNC